MFLHPLATKDHLQAVAILVIPTPAGAEDGRRHAQSCHMPGRGAGPALSLHSCGLLSPFPGLLLFHLSLLQTCHNLGHLGGEGWRCLLVTWAVRMAISSWPISSIALMKLSVLILPSLCMAQSRPRPLPACLHLGHFQLPSLLDHLVHSLCQSLAGFKAPS